MNNRQKLLETALELFASRGYTATGVQEIVDSAGVTKPTLYHYFGSKTGLLQELLESHFNHLNSALENAAEYHHDLTLNLQSLTKAYFETARDDSTAYRLQLALWFAPQESEAFQLVASFNQQQYQIVEDLFQKAAADHGNMRGRHRSLAASLIGMINTYIGLWLNDYISLDDGLVYQVVHQFEHGIYS